MHEETALPLNRCTPTSNKAINNSHRNLSTDPQKSREKKRSYLRCSTARETVTDYNSQDSVLNTERRASPRKIAVNTRLRIRQTIYVYAREPVNTNIQPIVDRTSKYNSLKTIGVFYYSVSIQAIDSRDWMDLENGSQALVSSDQYVCVL